MKPKEPKSAAETLVLSKKLISPRGRWAQGAYKIPPGSPDWIGKAVDYPRFCSLGAIKEVDGPFEDAAISFLQRAIDSLEEYRYRRHRIGIIGFNDANSRKKRQVIAVFNKAIKLAREAERHGR
jgi:hypothetical protein